MKYERRIFINIFWIIIGIILFVCSTLNILDTFWSGMGAAFFVIGILQTIRQIRYRTDAVYREKFDTEVRDERNKFIANKCWAWSGYIYVLTAGILTIIFAILDQHLLMMFTSCSLCFLIFVYWICYFILRRKY